MDNTAARHALMDVRIWAKARIAAGFDKPEARYQYMKLIEAADAILRDLDSAKRREAGPQTDRRLRLVEAQPGKESDEACRVVVPAAPLPA